MSSRGSSEQYINELEEQLQELLEKNEELEEKLQQQNKDNKVLEDALASAQTSRDWAEGEKEELAKQLAEKEVERREAVGVQVLDKDQFDREIEGLQETLDGLRAEHSQKLAFLEKRCSKHARQLLAATAELNEKTQEVKQLRAQLGASPQEPPPAEEEEERKKSWSTDFSTDFGGPVAFGDSAARTLADELGDEFSSEPGSPPSSSRPHSPCSSRPHSPTSAASPAPSAPYDSDDGSNATGVTYDDDNRPDDTDDGSHATGLTHDDDHDTSSHPDSTVEHEDAQIEQEEPIAEQDEPEIQEDEPAEEQELETEDQPAEEAYPEEETTEDQTPAVDDDDDEQGYTGSEFLEGDSSELQDQPAGAASPYGPLKSLLTQERPLAFDDHNQYEEAFRPASPPYGQSDSDATSPSDALQAVQMFPQERAARNNLARQVQESKTKLDSVVADLQQEKTDEVQAVKDSFNDYLSEIDARHIKDLQNADLRRVQDLEAADARRLTDLHEAQSKVIGLWKAFAERIRVMLQYSAALEAITRQQGVDVSYLEDRRPDAKRTEDELNEMASRNDLVVSPMRLAHIHPRELVADIPSIRISPPSEESSPTTTAPPPNSPTSDGSSPTSPTSPTSTTTTTAAMSASCPRLHVWLWPLLAFLFTLLTLFWFAGLSESERKLWDDANDGARLSTLGHFGYGGRLSYRLFTPVSRTLYADGGYLPEQQQQQQVWMHPFVRVSAALVEPVFASVQVVVAGCAVVLGCLVGLR